MGPDAAAAATAALLALAGALAASARPPSEVVLAIVLAFVPYATLAVRPLPAGRAVPTALGLAALAGLALVVAPPVLSDDVYRYLWDARVLGHGLDPYAFAPSDPALEGLRDALHARVNHADVPTIYPPVAQAIFALASSIAHAPWAMKLAALAAHLWTVPVVARLAGPRRDVAAPLFALNPLALEEAALGGHVDAFAGLFVALAILAAVRGRSMGAALALGLASGVKLVGLALAPLLLRRPRALVLALALGAAALAPIALAGHARSTSSGLGHYARRWRGNEGGFAVLSSACTLGLEGVGRATGAPPGWVRLDAIAPVLVAIERTPLDPRAALRAPKKAVARPFSFETAQLGDFLARGLAALVVLSVGLRHARRDTPPLRAGRDVLFALLLVAPQVHPWYLAWLLPLELAVGGLSGWIWSAAVLVAYAPLDGWVLTRRWDEAPWARVVEYGLVLGAWALERRRGATDVA